MASLPNDLAALDVLATNEHNFGLASAASVVLGVVLLVLTLAQLWFARRRERRG